MMLTKNSSFGGEHLHFYGWHELELWLWKEDQLLASSIVVRTFSMDGGPGFRGRWSPPPTSRFDTEPLGAGMAVQPGKVQSPPCEPCGAECGWGPQAAPRTASLFLHGRPISFIAHWTQKQMNGPTCLPLSQTLKKFLSKKVLPSDSLFVVAVWKIQVISHNIMLYMWTWWFCCYF